MTRLSKFENEIRLKEISTPNSIANYGAVYVKSDDCLYFQDGSGIEHHIVIDGHCEMYIVSQTAIPIVTTNEWHAALGFTEGENTGFTFDAGTNGAITVFADSGGGQVTVTSAGHGLPNGAPVTIVGTTNYNDVYLVSNVATDTFEITETFAGNDATGTFLNPSTMTVAVGQGRLFDFEGSLSGSSDSTNQTFELAIFVNGAEVTKARLVRRFANQDIGNLSGGAFIDLQDGDIVWAAIRNLTSAGDFTIENTNLRLS
jgi:hypothetical protein